MRLITWNIGGGRRINSYSQWDYTNEDLQYFTDQINELDPDLVMLQETLTSPKRIQAEQLSQMTGLSYSLNIAMSPDHINPEEYLSCSVISKKPLNDAINIIQPYPDFPLVFKDGHEANRFDKYFMKFKIGGVTFINTQIQPLHYWGYKYMEGKGKDYASKLETSLTQILETPAIICGDFQFGELESVMPNLFKKLFLIEALPNEPTRIRADGNNTRSDHILISRDFKIVESKVIHTQTDHRLGFTEITI
jgi:exonuclease III